MFKGIAGACVASTLALAPIKDDTVVVRVGEYPNKPGKRIELALDENYGENYPLTEDRELCEYYINKQIAVETVNTLKEIRPDANVILQDTHNRSADLNNAGKIAKEGGAKVYLSVHTNYSDNENAKGAYFITGNGATWGDNNLADRLNNRMGSRDNTLNVDYIGELNEIDDYDTVAVLGEYGFFSNREERQTLTNPIEIRKMAQATAEEISYTLDILNRK